MKICIVADSHDRVDALAQAVREAKAQGAAAVVHCGDVIGAQTLRPAMALGLPLHVIHGNNFGDPQALHFQMQVCCGHSLAAGVDQVAYVRGGRTWLVNPGTVAGLAAPATWIFAELDAMHFDIRWLDS